MEEPLLEYVRVFRVKELQHVLKQFGLPYTGGKKADLVQRITTFIRYPRPWPRPRLAHDVQPFPTCPRLLPCDSVKYRLRGKARETEHVSSIRSMHGGTAAVCLCIVAALRSG